MLARLIAGVSLAHLGLCYVYLYFLYRGFGGDVSALFTASDVLNVSLGEIVPFYIFFLPGLFFNHLWMIDKPFKLADRDEFDLHPQVNRPRMKWLWVLIAFLAPAAQIFAHFSGRPVLLIGLLFPLIFIAAWIINQIIRENDISPKYGLPSVLGFVGLLQISTGAYAEGFSARHGNYGSFHDAPRLCASDKKVVFAVGDHYIGVSKDGVRQAVSRDCEVRLTFEGRKVIIDLLPI